MADYSYQANANLVLRADRSLITRRDDEPTGEVETLVGRLNPNAFGDRAEKEKPISNADASQRKKKDKSKKKRKEDYKYISRKL